MDEASLRYVRKRHVIHVGGFDPIDAERLDHRVVGGVSKLASLWNISARASKPEFSADGRLTSWQVDTGGPNWSTETRYTVLRWDDLIAVYMGAPWWRQILRGFAAIFHFALNGTIFRYFSANARYGMFVLYPVFLAIGFLALSFYAGRTIARADFPFSAVLGMIVGFVLFVGLLRWAGDYFHLFFALADWSFAVDLVRGNAPDLEKYFDQFAEEVVSSIRRDTCDEVVLSGVSLGAVMMAETLARALARDPDLCRRGPAVAFLTIGSSILKIGLHPKAESLKSAVARISREPSLFWIEYQSKVDPINFFKTDPVERMGLQPTGKPIVKTIRIRETMTPEEYRYLKMNFLRLHRQFAMPNTRRYFYDFYLICFGPMSLTDRVALGQKATLAIGEDGSFRSIPLPETRKPVGAAT